MINCCKKQNILCKKIAKELIDCVKLNASYNISLSFTLTIVIKIINIQVIYSSQWLTNFSLINKQLT